eukprot:gnl/MRDRNA2_/MRDRNA2_102643_c0_seq1.p1 gnl/MRDRNA2_/MRDRNA2_102643_c0~~gnl/MRDRNA2_/MRDRNA2_102643_c0_seq1.p1  ORF type:complete len:406 (+),score=80.65 gnl/MRDRNA2_/MRDRNA2_102643_c0_seq1:57-1274(+)
MDSTKLNEKLAILTETLDTKGQFHQLESHLTKLGIPEQTASGLVASFKASTAEPQSCKAFFEWLTGGMKVAEAEAKESKAESEKPKQADYFVLATPDTHDLAESLVAYDPQKFEYKTSKWKKFPDGTDNITVGGFTPDNVIRGRDVIFLASFSSNEVFMSQLHVFILLSESFLGSLTIVLPFLPTATMDRTLQEGRIATGNTTSKLLSCLPPIGKGRTRVMLYDVHTLQNQFFFGGSCVATLHTAAPMVIDRISKLDASEQIDCIAFPDEGAHKRFGRFFKNNLPTAEVVVCSKERTADGGRVVVISDGNPDGKNVVIVDDLIQTGGTLYECAAKVKASGAKSVSGFVMHAVFPNESWRRFLRSGDRSVFSRFWVTNSNPTVSSTLPTDDVFEVLNLMPQIVKDL